MSLLKYFDLMRPLSMIFDVGCDDFSFSTKELRQAFPDATIHAFEPDPRHIASIKDGKKDEALNIKFHPFALAEICRTRKFWQSTSDDPTRPEWPYSGSIKEPRTLDHKAGDFFHFKPEPMDVWCETLDMFCATSHIEKIDLLHMDVQGGEDLVLKGAVKMLPHIRYIYAEHNTGGIYKDAPGLEGLKALLPGWDLAETFAYDALFKNRSFP